MTKLLTIITILISIFLASCEMTTAGRKKMSNHDTLENNKLINDGRNPYFMLKNMAFNLRFDDLQLEATQIPHGLYGVIFDWEVAGGAVLSFVSFISGDASLYFSSGACLIGGTQNKEIRSLAKSFILASEKLIDKGVAYNDSLTTVRGCVSLYLLTTSGKFLIRDNADNVIKGNSNLSQLYNMTNDIITEFRKADEARQKQK